MEHSCCKTFSKIGSAITFARNLVFNAIFLLVIILVFFSIIISLSTSKETTTKSFRKTPILEIDIVNTINDAPSFMSPTEELISSFSDTDDDANSRHHVKEVVDSIDYATKDSQIKSIFLNLSRTDYISLDIVQNVGASLNNFKKAGKKVYVYAYSYNQSTYALASYADIIYMDPLGSIDLNGFSLKTLYYKDLLDNVMLSVYTPKAGTHKSAVEPYNRNDMSPQVKDEYHGVVNELWQQYSDIILKNRPKVNFNSMIFASDNYLNMLKQNNGDMAKMALNLGFVDQIKNPYNSLADIAKLTNTTLKTKNGDEKLRSAKMSEYLEAKQNNNKGEPNIAIVYGIGEISSSSDSSADFTAQNIIPQLKSIGENTNIKAVVLYLNTPGGEVFASELIRRQLVKLRNKGKKIVVYMAGMTASGGYWISSTADKIIAQPSTITGSIGVLAITGSVDKLINHYGIHVDGVTTNENGSMSIFTPITNNLKETLQISIDNTYDNFVNLVAKGRNLTPKYVDSIAQGKIYTGARGKEIGLVDNIGDLKEAISIAAELAKIKDPINVMISTPKDLNNISFISSILGKAISKVDKPLAIDFINKLSNHVPQNILKADGKIQVISLTPVEMEHN